jgi:DNA-binding Xre family transcriptional regulator
MELIDKIVMTIDKKRAEYGWSVDKTAREADIPFSTLNSIRQKKVKDVTFTTIISLAKAFKCSIDEFKI